MIVWVDGAGIPRDQLGTFVAGSIHLPCHTKLAFLLLTFLYPPWDRRGHFLQGSHTCVYIFHVFTVISSLPAELSTMMRGTLSCVIPVATASMPSLR